MKGHPIYLEIMHKKKSPKKKKKKKQTSKESVEARKERARGTREADESSVGFMSMAVETFDGGPWICKTDTVTITLFFFRSTQCISVS